MFITPQLSSFGGCFVIQCGIWHAGVWGIDATTSVAGVTTPPPQAGVQNDKNP